jgi:hypothetical protein
MQGVSLLHGFGRAAAAAPAYPPPVDETLTDGVELVVGLGCVAAAVPASRVRRLRWLGVVLLVAGAVAIAHAAFRLAS